MGLRKRLLSAALAVCLLGGVLTTGYIATKNNEELEPTISNAKETLYFWYTDDSLTDYLNSVSLDYYEATDYKIVPVLKSGLEYLETIYAASKQGEEMPDLYVVSNDALEKAYLAGLACVVKENGEFVESSYPESARNAVNYRGKTVGYPFYFETSAFLFNKTYMQDLAKSILEQQSDVEAAEEAAEMIEAMGSEEEALEAMAQQDATELSEEELEHRAEEKIGEIIPAAMDDILAFADEYDAPEQVEAVFKWDVTDIFYNYFVIGNYMDVGGPAGDDAGIIDIYNQEAADCLTVYQNLNQFFSIDTKEVSYDSVLQDFLDGKIVFTVATTDAVGRIEQARAEGDFSYDYGVAPVPDMSGELSSRSLSVTNAVVVNGFSEKQDIAHDFARFLLEDNSQALYGRTGKVPAIRDVDYDYEGLKGFVQEYENSVPMPKMMAASNFWVKLEICFSKIWKGADIDEQLRTLSEEIQQQILGKSE